MDDGARVMLISTAEARGFLKLAEPLLRMSTERQLMDGMDRLKAIMEAGA